MDLIGTKVCMTKDLGVHGNLFGGKMMSWIDESAAAYACMYCDNPRMVTVKVSELIFQRPVKVGEMVRFYGNVKKIGNTSITLHLDVKIHNPVNGNETLCTTTDIVFVSINQDGKSIPIKQNIKDKFKTSNTLRK